MDPTLDRVVQRCLARDPADRPASARLVLAAQLQVGPRRSARALLLVRAPLTLDWSSWYAGRSFAVLGILAGLLVMSAFLTLGGKPAFGKALLGD